MREKELKLKIVPKSKKIVTKKTKKAVRRVEGYVAVDESGCGWDMRYGKTLYPEIFTNSETATTYARAIEERWWGIRLKVIPATLTYKVSLPPLTKKRK